MRKTVRLTENDIIRLVKSVINEQNTIPVMGSNKPRPKLSMAGKIQYSCDWDNFKWVRDLIKNTNDFTVEIDPEQPQRIVVRDKGRNPAGCRCKREELFILQ